MATVRVIDVMDLVKDHRIQPVQRHECADPDLFRGRASLEQEVAQNLRGHHNDLRIRAEFDVAGHNSHRGLRKQLLQVVEFLVGQRLDGRCVKDASAPG